MKLDVALMFVLMVNVLLMISQSSVDNIAEVESVDTVTFFSYSQSILKEVDSGNMTVSSDVNLGSSGGSITVDSGNIFTDTFSALKNWLLDTTGFNYLKGIVTAFPNFLQMIGLPNDISYALGALWHIFTLFLIISWIGGRL